MSSIRELYSPDAILDDRDRDRESQARQSYQARESQQVRESRVSHVHR